VSTNEDGADAAEWEIPPVVASEPVAEDAPAIGSIYAEKQYSLLVDALETSWRSRGETGSYLAVSNVGMFHGVHIPPVVPGFLLSDDIELPLSFRTKDYRYYCFWEFGKPPDAVVEVVSDRHGGEDTYKFRQYARLAISYYAIYDPDNILGKGVLRTFGCHPGGYHLLADNWLPALGLGLRVWHGRFSGAEEDWLRWCDRQGQVLLTSRERLEQERQRAETLEERLRRLEAQLRAAGIEPAP
jgi:hypothetical protein